MDKEPIKNHMEKPPETRKPTEKYPCPKGFPPEKWIRKGEGYKKNYYTVVLKQAGK